MQADVRGLISANDMAELIWLLYIGWIVLAELYWLNYIG
jgi:hypothetical protein